MPLNTIPGKEPEDCAHLGYKEHHVNYFDQLFEDVDHAECVLCLQSWDEETIMEEMEVGDYDG